LEENKEFNDKEEKRCLEEYEQILVESYVPFHFPKRQGY
jgi:hypothetical protein